MLMSETIKRNKDRVQKIMLRLHWSLDEAIDWLENAAACPPELECPPARVLFSVSNLFLLLPAKRSDEFMDISSLRAASTIEILLAFNHDHAAVAEIEVLFHRLLESIRGKMFCL